MLNEYTPLQKKGLALKLKKRFWFDVGTRIVLIGLLLLLSTFLYLINITHTKINYIIITIPLFLILLLSLESSIVFYYYLNFIIGWTWRLCVVSLLIYLGMAIQCLQYNQYSYYEMNYPLMVCCLLLFCSMVLYIIPFFLVRCGFFKERVNEINSIYIILFIIALVVGPGVMMIVKNYDGSTEDHVEFSYCFISFYVGDSIAIVFLLYCCKRIFYKTPILYASHILLLLGTSTCSIIFKVLVTYVLDDGVYYNNFLLFLPLIISQLLIILFGVTLIIYPLNIPIFEKNFQLEAKKTYNIIEFSYSKNKISLIKPMSPKNVRYLGTKKNNHHLLSNINKLNIIDESSGIVVAGVDNKLFFKVWRNIVTRRLISHHLKQFELNYNIKFYSVKSLINWPNRRHLLKITLKFNDDLFPGLVPYGVEHIVFCNTFNKELYEDVFPKHIKSIEFGDNFNKSLKFLTNLNSLTHLKIGNLNSLSNIPLQIKSLTLGNFNKKLISGTIPSNIKYLDLGSTFNRKIRIGSIPNSVNYLLLSDSYCKKIENNSLENVNIFVVGGHTYSFINHDEKKKNLFTIL